MSGPIWLGVGGAKPQPRVLKNSMFGHVVDAFDEKTITKIGEESPYDKRMKAMKEAEKNKEEKLKNGDEKEDASDISESQQCDIKEAVDLIKIINQDLRDNETAGLLLKGGTVVNNDGCFPADVLIQHNKIVSVEPSIEESPNNVVVDVSNKYILPGGIDLTNGFGSAPFKDVIQSVDFQTGAKAALAGGITLIAHGVEPEIGQSYLEAYEDLIVKLRSTEGDNEEMKGDVICCDYVVRVGLTWWSEQVQKEVEQLVNQKGVSLFYIPSDISFPDNILISICKCLKAASAVLQVYCSDPVSTQKISKELEMQGITGPEGCYYSYPEEAELLSLHRYICIASTINLPLYVCCLSSRAAAQLIARKRREGKVIFSEVAIANLTLDGSKILNSDWVTAAHHVTFPPIRMQEFHSRYLLDQLAINDIQVVSSNHHPFSTCLKAFGKDHFSLIPPGIPSLQQRNQLLWSRAVSTGMMDASRFVSCTSSMPAKLLGLYPNKGMIAPSSDADLIVLDAKKDHKYDQDKSISRCDFNVFQGMVAKAAVDMVIKQGRVVIDKGTFQDFLPGSLLTCPSPPDVAFSRIKLRDESANWVKGIEREPYDGPISGHDINSANHLPSHAAGQRSENFCRPPTRSGGRNMQDTTLSISVEGTFADDPIKCQKLGGYRVNQPPGGRTTQFW